MRDRGVTSFSKTRRERRSVGPSPACARVRSLEISARPSLGHVCDRVAVAWPVPRVTDYGRPLNILVWGPFGPERRRKHAVTKIIAFAVLAFALALSAAIGLNTRPQSPVVDHSRVVWTRGPPLAQPCSAPGGTHLSPCALDGEAR